MNRYLIVITWGMYGKKAYASHTTTVDRPDMEGALRHAAELTGVLPPRSIIATTVTMIANGILARGVEG